MKLFSKGYMTLQIIYWHHESVETYVTSEIRDNFTKYIVTILWSETTDSIMPDTHGTLEKARSMHVFLSVVGEEISCFNLNFCCKKAKFGVLFEM